MPYCKNCGKKLEQGQTVCSLCGTVADGKKDSSSNGCLVGVIIAVVGLFLLVFFGGCLTAIALPQYARAIERARASEAIMTIQELSTSQQLYHELHGKYSDNFQELEVRPENCEKGNECCVGSECNFRLKLETPKGKIVAFREGNATHQYRLEKLISSKEWSCVAGNGLGQSMCAHLCGVDTLTGNACCSDGTQGECRTK